MSYLGKIARAWRLIYEVRPTEEASRETKEVPLRQFYIGSSLRYNITNNASAL